MNQMKRELISLSRGITKALCWILLFVDGWDNMMFIRMILPSGDRNEWYYPSRPYDSDDDELQAGTPMGNWGRKHLKSARFVRKGKMAPWGPGREEYDVRLIILLESISAHPDCSLFVSRRSKNALGPGYATSSPNLQAKKYLAIPFSPTFALPLRPSWVHISQPRCTNLRSRPLSSIPMSAGPSALP